MATVAGKKGQIQLNRLRAIGYTPQLLVKSLTVTYKLMYVPKARKPLIAFVALRRIYKMLFFPHNALLLHEICMNFLRFSIPPLLSSE